MRHARLIGLSLVVGLAACAGREAPRKSPGLSPADAAVAERADSAVALIAPGLRLPDDVTPLAYELRLEIDPETERFRGEVSIRATVEHPIDHVWMHAVGLELERMTWQRAGATQPLRDLAVQGDEMRAFGFGQTLAAGEVTLAFTYSGAVGSHEEGLFRQRDRGRWFAYSQAESMFARHILPCFDEPRWKIPWHVTLVVPDGQIALGNAAETRSTKLADGRREVQFATTPPMASYLLAVAVGPFTLVNAGTLGAQHIPLRVAVHPDDAKQAGITAVLAPPLAVELERYFESPLPWSKLDFVAVPHFFGAMENPGLFTFQRTILVGAVTDRSLISRFAQTAAHELAHLWFGDLVTFAWWDDLWLAEAFASWMSDKVAADLRMFDDDVFHLATARQRALEADDAIDARALHRTLAKNSDADNEFDAISYEKGAAVLAMFERFVGKAGFQRAINSYLRAHHNGTASAADLIVALEHASTPATARALASFLDRAGAPVVEFTLDCSAKPARLIAHAHDATVPACVRYPHPQGDQRTCALVGDRTEIAFAAGTGCPAWVVGNDGGLGYYRATGYATPVAQLSSAERVARGDDIAAGLIRGEVSLTDALAALRLLAATNEPYARLGAIAIARAIDPGIEEAERPRWVGWLGARFADALGFALPGSAPSGAVREALVDLGAALPAATVTRARKELERALLEPTRLYRSQVTRLLAFASPTGGKLLFDRLVAALAVAPAAKREMLLAGLGWSGPDFAAPIVALALAENPSAWSTIEMMLERGVTRAATWRALRPHVAELLAKLAPDDAGDVIAATASACDAATRAEVAATFEPLVAAIDDGRRTLDHALASIDRCVARRAVIGAVGGKL